MNSSDVATHVVLLTKVMGAIVGACLTAPCRESRILICDTGKVTTERRGYDGIKDNRVRAPWPATSREALETVRA